MSLVGDNSYSKFHQQTQKMPKLKGLQPTKVNKPYKDRKVLTPRQGQPQTSDQLPKDKVKYMSVCCGTLRNRAKAIVYL